MSERLIYCNLGVLKNSECINSVPIAKCQEPYKDKPAGGDPSNPTEMMKKYCK